MFLAPHLVAYECNRLEDVVPHARKRGVRWTWIAGNRYQGVRWN